MKAESIRILTLDPADDAMVEQCALILVRAFKPHHPLAWPTLVSAKEAVVSFSREDRISLVAIDSQTQVLGWVGAIRQYAGHAWELHPLAVDPSRQLHGVGTRLVQALLESISKTKASTLYLLTDDENSQTSLANLNLYPSPMTQLMGITNVNHHPFEFYLKLGFCITGVIPDANGPGKPDILMSKSLLKTVTTSASHAGHSHIPGCS